MFSDFLNKEDVYLDQSSCSRVWSDCSCLQPSKGLLVGLFFWLCRLCQPSGATRTCAVSIYATSCEGTKDAQPQKRAPKASSASISVSSTTLIGQRSCIDIASENSELVDVSMPSITRDWRLGNGDCLLHQIYDLFYFLICLYSSLTDAEIRKWWACLWCLSRWTECLCV